MRVALAGALALSFVPLAVAETLPLGMAARTELHSIETLTLSDAQFLKGDPGGKATMLTGELRIPSGSGRLPLVMLQHGSGGMAANLEMWAREFNAMGISTFALDGFTGRGLTAVNTNQALLGRLNFILDNYRALEILAKHPRVDAQRIVLMGFSDDYNPVALCKPFVDRLHSAGKDVELTVYPTASHAFDNPLGSVPPAEVKGGQTVRHCSIREEPEGTLINASTREPFSYKDPCVELNPHVGYDAAATEAAKKSVKEFLSVVFKLEPQTTANHQR
jgi:dienelactone hydrolase